jgi:hypothetical protein
MTDEPVFPQPGRGLRDRMDRGSDLATGADADSEAPIGSPPVSEPSSNDDSGGARTHLLFVWSPTGYRLAEQEGAPPSTGDVVEHGEQRYRVSKIGPSPLPGDERLCAYLQG